MSNLSFNNKLKEHLRNLLLKVPIVRFFVTRIYLFYIRRDLVTVVDNGNLLYIPNSRIRTVGNTYEPYTTHLFKSSINYDSNVLDIGANLGHFTVIAAKRAYRGTVFAFEPEQFSFRLLQLNCNVNRCENVKTYNYACWDSVKTLTLAVTLQNLGTHKIVQKKDSLTKKTLSPRESVKAVPVDNIIDNIRIDVAKIDAEGSEVRILYGMRKTIKRSSPLRMFIECNPRLLNQSGFSVNQLLNLLNEFGFEYRAVLEEQKRLVPFDMNIANAYPYVNLICDKS